MLALVGCASPSDPGPETGITGRWIDLSHPYSFRLELVEQPSGVVGGEVYVDYATTPAHWSGTVVGLRAGSAVTLDFGGALAGIAFTGTFTQHTTSQLVGTVAPLGVTGSVSVTLRR